MRLPILGLGFLTQPHDVWRPPGPPLFCASHLGTAGFPALFAPPRLGRGEAEKPAAVGAAVASAVVTEQWMNPGLVTRCFQSKTRGIPTERGMESPLKGAHPGQIQTGAE